MLAVVILSRKSGDSSGNSTQRKGNGGGGEGIGLDLHLDITGDLIMDSLGLNGV